MGSVATDLLLFSPCAAARRAPAPATADAPRRAPPRAGRAGQRPL